MQTFANGRMRRPPSLRPRPAVCRTLGEPRPLVRPLPLQSPAAWRGVSVEQQIENLRRSWTIHPSGGLLVMVGLLEQDLHDRPAPARPVALAPPAPVPVPVPAPTGLSRPVLCTGQG